MMSGSAQPSLSSGSFKTEYFEFCFAGLTDPGGPNKQNQDDFFIHAHADPGCVAFGLFDGHGREVGMLAALSAKLFMLDELSRPDSMAKIRSDPTGTIMQIFRGAHAAVERVGPPVLFERFVIQINYAMNMSRPLRLTTRQRVGRSRASMGTLPNDEGRGFPGNAFTAVRVWALRGIFCAV